MLPEDFAQRAGRLITGALQVFERGTDIPSTRRSSQALIRAAERLSLVDGEDRSYGSRSQTVRVEAVTRLKADPLRRVAEGQAFEPIHAFVPLHPKDEWFGHLSVASLRENLPHPLRSLTLCIPDGAEAPPWAHQYEVTVQHDSQVLASLGAAGPRIAGMPGWFRQQALKFAFVAAADAPTLVHDADTLLLRSRVWIAGDVQILPIRRKAPGEFARSTARILGQRSPLRHASAVTHHQLMQGRIIRSRFGEGAAFVDRLERWVLGEGDAGRPSEYQLYGSILRLEGRSGWVPASWRHAQGRVRPADVRGLPPLTGPDALRTLRLLRDEHPGLYGLTLHVRG